MLGGPSLPRALRQVPVGLEETKSQLTARSSQLAARGNCDPNRRCRALGRWPLRGELGSSRGDGSPHAGQVLWVTGRCPGSESLAPSRHRARAQGTAAGIISGRNDFVILKKHNEITD